MNLLLILVARIDGKINKRSRFFIFLFYLLPTLGPLTAQSNIGKSNACLSDPGIYLFSNSQFQARSLLVLFLVVTR